MSPSGLIPASLSKTLYYPEKIHWLQAIQKADLPEPQPSILYHPEKLWLEGRAAWRGAEPGARE